MADKTLPELRQDLVAFGKQPYNQKCADCGDTGESMKRTWISTNLGVFLCINCAGIHRSLGTHITTILCLELDIFNDANQVEHILRIGNNIANQCWVTSNPSIRNVKPSEFLQDKTLMKLYIEAKYTGKDFKKPVNHQSPALGRSALTCSGIMRISAGILRVELLKGVGLKSVDYNGLSDPYVNFTVCGRNFKSTIVKKSLNPVWKQTIMINIDDCQGPIEISCWDHNKYTSDVSLGRTRIDSMVYFLDEKEHFMVLKLEKGEIHVNFQFTKL